MVSCCAQLALRSKYEERFYRPSGTARELTILYWYVTVRVCDLCVQNETLSEKEIKRLGFALAETRYNELLPLLARLNELEQQQAEEEAPGHHRVGGRSVGHSGGSGGSTRDAPREKDSGAGSGKGKSGKDDRDKGGSGKSPHQQQSASKKGKDKK
jgi:hypothetical protein